MQQVIRAFWRALPVCVVGSALVFGGSAAYAQFGPPSTVYGSISDSAGQVAAGVPVEAWIGNTRCDVPDNTGAYKGKTEFVGDGSTKVTAYFVHVVSDGQKPGCGTDGVEIKVKVGDRFADQTARWKAGPVELNITFGGAPVAAIPTFTPAPTTAPDATATVRPIEVRTQQAVSAAATGTAAGPNGQYATATALKGGVKTTNAKSTDANASDGGFPVWGWAVGGLSVVGLAAGAVGFAMTRKKGTEEEDEPLPPAAE